jgi:aryl-alcohol dehydrogenase-like predicted oxidoreductase
MNRHEFILRFTLSHPGVSSAIAGASKPGHLRSNVAAASRGPLPGEVYTEARRRLAAA